MRKKAKSSYYEPKSVLMETKENKLKVSSKDDVTWVLKLFYLGNNFTLIA